MTRSYTCVVVLGGALALGCSASASSPSLAVGSEGAGGENGVGGSGTFKVDDAGLSKALAAHIEQNDITVRIIRLNCAGDCADVVAVATGGYAPYGFAWDDGSTNPERRLCPTANASYRVAVTDTGATSGEFPRPPKTVNAAVTAEVLSCVRDGGADAADGGEFFGGPCDSLAASFAPAGTNPTAAWSYGWSSTVGGAFTRYPTFVAQDLKATAYSGIGFPSVAQWFDQSLGVVSTNGAVPDIQFNPSNAPVYPGNGNFTGNSWVVQPGQIVMTANSLGTAFSIARWTAPNGGTYGVKAAFASAAVPGFSDTADIHVQHDGVDLPSSAGSITATNTTFAFSSGVTVAAGDTVDFVVGAGAGLVYHLVSVNAAICSR